MDTDLTPEQQRLITYRARVNVHRSCGIRTNGTVPTTCQRCDMLDAYYARREMYRNELDDADPAEETAHIKRERPVNFRQWLRTWQYPPVTETPEVDVDWSVWAA